MTKSTTTTTNEKNAIILFWAFFGLCAACVVGSVGPEPVGPDANEYRKTITPDGTTWVHSGQNVCSRHIGSERFYCGPSYNGGAIKGMPRSRLAGGHRTLQL